MEDPGYAEPDARELVAAYEQVRARARGMAAGPASWLPATGPALAGALQVALGADPDRAAIVRFKEGLVDLQAFIPDDDAEAAERVAAGNPRDEADRGTGAAALERVLESQAMAICWLRDDDRVLGAMNALRPLDGVRIGDAERALAAVDRYKESQGAGFVSMVGGPVAVVVGAVVGVLLIGFTVVGAVLAAVLAGAYVLLGPIVGHVIGEVASRARRAAVRLPGDRLAAIAATIVEVLMVGALIMIPVAIGFFTIAIGRAIGGS